MGEASERARIVRETTTARLLRGLCKCSTVLGHSFSDLALLFQPVQAMIESMTARISRLPWLFIAIVLATACAKEDDGSTASSTSSGGSEGTGASGTTDVAPTTGTTTDGVSTTSGATSAAEGSSDTGTPAEEICGPFAAHFVECFPNDSPGVEMVRMLCQNDITPSRGVEMECTEALRAYYACLALAPCDVYEDSCTAEAQNRIDSCGG